MISTDHTNKGVLIFVIVVIKFIAPIIDDAPAQCRLKIAVSTLPPTNDEPRSKNNAGGNNQKLKLLSLGKAISGAPINRGTNQFPNPPINTGITRKKIIIKACAVTTTL